jgi:hypothetical protein
LRLQTEPTQTKAILTNGSIIYSLPSGWTGAGLRFLTTDVIVLEEAAYIPDEVYTAVRPMIATTKGQIIMFSTPCGPHGFFYRCWHDEMFAKWNMPSTECSRIPKDFLESERKRMSKLEFQREYEGSFTQVYDGLIDIELIQKQMLHKECNHANIHYLGVDVARFGKADSVIAFCEYNRETKKSHLCRVEIIKGPRRTTHLVGQIMNIMRTGNYNIKKVIVDETGIGSGPVDCLVEKLGKRMILGINNAARGVEDTSEGRRRRYIKEDLYSNLIRLLEKEDLTLDDDINILRSLRNVRFEYASTGNLRIFGPDSDVAEAIVRAVFPLLYTTSMNKGLYVKGISNINLQTEMIDDSKFVKEQQVFIDGNNEV